MVRLVVVIMEAVWQLLPRHDAGDIVLPAQSPVVTIVRLSGSPGHRVDLAVGGPGVLREPAVLSDDLVARVSPPSSALHQNIYIEEVLGLGLQLILPLVVLTNDINLLTIAI